MEGLALLLAMWKITQMRVNGVTKLGINKDEEEKKSIYPGKSLLWKVVTFLLFYNVPNDYTLLSDFLIFCLSIQPFNHKSLCEFCYSIFLPSSNRITIKFSYSYSDYSYSSSDRSSKRYVLAWTAIVMPSRSSWTNYNVINFAIDCLQCNTKHWLNWKQIIS